MTGSPPQVDGATVISMLPRQSRVRAMTAVAVMQEVEPGDGHSWVAELEFLWTTLRHRVLDVMDSVLAEGFQEPILIGPDGRLWDGHHRLAVALALNLKVPVEFAGKAGKDA